jgi:Fanconi-associated nuclease 1
MQNGRHLEGVTAIRDLTDWRDLIEVCCHVQSSNLILGCGRVGTLTGHVLTRIVQKGAEALGTLKEYDRELEVLEALLNQRHWRRGRRGKWYERRALILTRYCDKSPETLMRTMRGILDSLNDRDTHLGEWTQCLVN